MKQAMSENGLTLEDVARKTGLVPSAIRWIMDNGDVMADELERIAEAVGLSTQNLAAPDIMGADSTGGCCENVIEFIRDDIRAGVTLSQKRYINKVKELAEQYPDQVTILAENKDGSIFAHMPVTWIIKPGKPAELNLTDEQRKERADQLARNKLKLGELSSESE
jgi:transcriptional regulator with XRE-family HTH domain